jgi:hypothetical protein
MITRQGQSGCGLIASGDSGLLVLKVYHRERSTRYPPLTGRILHVILVFHLVFHHHVGLPRLGAMGHRILYCSSSKLPSRLDAAVRLRSVSRQTLKSNLGRHRYPKKFLVESPESAATTALHCSQIHRYPRFDIMLRLTGRWWCHLIELRMTPCGFGLGQVLHRVLNPKTYPHHADVNCTGL